MEVFTEKNAKFNVSSGRVRWDDVSLKAHAGVPNLMMES